MNRKIIQIFYILLVSSFVIGCNSDDDCNCSSTVMAELNESISETNFQEGLIIKETTIEIKSEDKELLSTVTVKEDTQFEDINGVAITETPILVVKTTKEEDTSTSIIKFNAIGGEPVTPTKSFKVGMKAPAGAKTGDRVKVEVPNEGNTQIQKTIIRIVDANGFVFFEITINDRKNSVVLITITLLGNGATN